MGIGVRSRGREKNVHKEQKEGADTRGEQYYVVLGVKK